jgi:hypothetical protein
MESRLSPDTPFPPAKASNPELAKIKAFSWIWYYLVRKFPKRIGLIAIRIIIELVCS